MPVMTHYCEDITLESSILLSLVVSGVIFQNDSCLIWQDCPSLRLHSGSSNYLDGLCIEMRSLCSIAEFNHS